MGAVGGGARDRVKEKSNSYLKHCSVTCTCILQTALEINGNEKNSYLLQPRMWTVFFESI